MILRQDRILIDLPIPKHPSPNSASAVQELLGGKYGEMSTLMNYTFQSFNFRGRTRMRPYYDLIANIAAEEYGHIELVAYTINLLLNGATTRGHNPDDAPLHSAIDARNAYHFIASGQAALPVDSMGNPWNGSFVTATGNLKMDLLFNFQLECGARANKMRVYEMVTDPTARKMVGYLLVRGGIHIVAYAKALEKLTGVEVGKLLPIPDLSNKKFDEAKKFEDMGLHRIMFRYSMEDYTRLGEIWNGAHPEDGSQLIVQDGPPEGVPAPDLDEEPQLTAPGVDAEMYESVLKKVMAS